MSARGEYRAIHTVLIDGPDFQSLSSDARICLLILKLSLGAAGIGVMYPSMLEPRTGLPLRKIMAALAELARSGWVLREKSVMWLVRGLEFEPTLSQQDAKHRSFVGKQLESLPRVRLIDSFRERYAGWFDAPSEPHGGPFEGPSEPLPSPFEAPGMALRSTETKTETKTEPKSPSLHAREKQALPKGALRGVERFLAGVPADRRHGWDRRVGNWLLGEDLPPGPKPTREVLALALDEYVDEPGAKYNTAHVWGFVASVMRRFAESTATGPPARNGKRFPNQSERSHTNITSAIEKITRKIPDPLLVIQAPKEQTQ